MRRLPKTLTFIAVALAVVSTALLGSTAFAGTIFSADFETSSGYRAGASTDIVDLISGNLASDQGWYYGPSAVPSSALVSLRTGTYAIDDTSVRFGVTDDADLKKWFGIWNDVSATPITDGTVDVYVDVKYHGSYLSVVFADDDYTGDATERGFQFGITAFSGFRIYDGSAGQTFLGPGGDDAYGGLTAGMTYTFHAVVDYSDNTYRLEVSDTNGLIKGFDDWYAEEGENGYDAFDFRGSGTIGFKSLGLRAYMYTSTGRPVYVDNVSAAYTAVPEPGTIALLLSGLVGMMIWRRRR